MEEYFIREYNSFIKFKNSNSYNITLGRQGTFGYKQSREKIEKQKELNSKEWKFINLEGNHIKIKNLNQYCKENNLTMSNIAILYEEYKNVNFSDYIPNKNRIYKFTNSLEELVIIKKSLNKFCKENNLCFSKMHLVNKGERKSQKECTKYIEEIN